MYNGANGDTFCEVLVSRRRGTPETVKAALAIIVGLVFSAVIILLVPMFFILLIPVWALVIFVVRMQKLEYEYIFTSGDLDIDVLIGNYKRKTRMSLSMENITLVAPENSYELDGTQIVTVMISVPIMSCRQIMSLSAIGIISRFTLNSHPMSRF